MIPPETQKRRKTEKGRSDDPLKTHSKKDTEKKGKHKPDLAREREARFSRITRKNVVEIF